MKLLVDEMQVEAVFVPLERCGFILQLLLADKVLFKELDEEFRRRLPDGGVMSKSEPDDDGNYEIRLLERTQLEAIDQMRTDGHGVRQELPDKDDV